MDDPLRLPALQALDAAGDYAPTSDEIIDGLAPLDTTPILIVTTPLIERTLRQLERADLVEEVVDAASYHAPDAPTPIAERRWRILEPGRRALRAYP
jgi:hypothetical protein